MNRVLNYLLGLTPRQVFIGVWLLLLVGFLVSGFRLFSGFAPVIGLTAMVGYSYVVVLGAGFAGTLVRRVAGILGAFLIALSAVLVATVPYMQVQDVSTTGSMAGRMYLAIVLPINAAVFVPFFLATRVIDEARRAKGTYKPLDCVPTFLALYFGVFGGLIYAHRIVRENFVAEHPRVSRGANAG